MPRSTLMYAPLFVVAAVWIAIGVEQGNSHELPYQSVVGGHRVQPNEAELNKVGRPDLSSSQADEIDHLYGVLLHCAEHSCAAEDDMMSSGKR